MGLLKDYEKIIGKEVASEIYRDAKELSGRNILHINSAYEGGGVAEILNNLIPLMNSLGINAGWRTLHAPHDFFVVAKKFFNALQGDEINLSQHKKRIYLEICRKFSSYTHIDHDAVIIHDAQPLPLINFYNKKQPWIWRCHMDISNPDQKIFDYMKQFITKYDRMVVLCDKFKKEGLIPQTVINPSIDPLSQKNVVLPEKVMEKQLSKFNIDSSKSIICQISRFDKWKDPEGVIKIFKKVRQKVPCQLVLLGEMAMDDPEGQRVYEALLKKVKSSEIHVINFNSDTLVNTLQTKSSVVIQKSVREGFGLTVSEALWKKTPVVASNVGGITEQIIDGTNGYLLDPQDINGFAERVVKLLKDKKLRDEMGAFGKSYVRERFLITRHLHDWINLLLEFLKNKS